MHVLLVQKSLKIPIGVQGFTPGSKTCQHGIVAGVSIQSIFAHQSDFFSLFISFNDNLNILSGFKSVPQSTEHSYACALKETEDINPAIK